MVFHQCKKDLKGVLEMRHLSGLRTMDKCESDEEVRMKIGYRDTLRIIKKAIRNNQLVASSITIQIEVGECFCESVCNYPN